MNEVSHAQIETRLVLLLASKAMHSCSQLSRRIVSTYRSPLSLTNQVMENKNEIIRLKRSKEFSLGLKSINAVISLLNNKKLWAEYALLKQLCPKIAIRIRNSPYSRSLEQLVKLTMDFKSLIESSIFKDIKSFFESINEDFKETNLLEHFDKQIKLLNLKLFLIVKLSTKAFRLAQVWLDLGQLVNHFLMISCVTSRISIYSKSLLVYLYDIYRIVWRLQKICSPNEVALQQDAMRPYLVKLNIKLRSNILNVKPEPKSATKSCAESNTVQPSFKDLNQVQLEDTKFNAADLGVPLDRSSLNKESSVNLAINQANNKNMKRNKQKHKNKGKLKPQENNTNSISKNPSNGAKPSINQKSKKKKANDGNKKTANSVKSSTQVSKKVKRTM